jgi:CopG family nickel-responsive transcriptional regulator
LLFAASCLSASFLSTSFLATRIGRGEISAYKHARQTMQWPESIAMQRVTITIDDELMTELDRIIEARGYQNRSEAIRDLVRAGIRDAAEGVDPKRDCVAALVYVYDHAARELSKRLADTFHDHHELSLASMHAHLDHDNCMEVTILRGKSDEVQHFAEHVIAERGVRHGRVVLVPTDVMIKPHTHADGTAHSHAHQRPAGKKRRRAARASAIALP